MLKQTALVALATVGLFNVIRGGSLLDSERAPIGNATIQAISSIDGVDEEILEFIQELQLRLTRAIKVTNAKYSENLIKIIVHESDMVEHPRYDEAMRVYDKLRKRTQQNIRNYID